MNRSDHLLKLLGIGDYSLEIAVKIGPLLIHPREIQRHLSRYALRFVSLNDDEIYEMQHLGTALGIKYRSRFFIIATNHQRSLGTDGELGVLSSFETRVVTPKTMWPILLSDSEERDDRLDFILYELEPASYSISSLASQFFEVDSTNQSTDPPSEIAINVGYPTRLQNVDYFAGEVNLLLASNFVRFVKQDYSNDIQIYRTVSEDRFFEDGMSGAPVFDIIRKNSQFLVRWLGIVVRGGQKSRTGRVIDAKYLTHQIERAAF